MTHFAFLRTRPRSQVPNCNRQSREGLGALGAKEMQFLVLVGSPDFVTHAELQPPGPGPNRSIGPPLLRPAPVICDDLVDRRLANPVVPALLVLTVADLLEDSSHT